MQPGRRAVSDEGRSACGPQRRRIGDFAPVTSALRFYSCEKSEDGRAVGREAVEREAPPRAPGL